MVLRVLLVACAENKLTLQKPISLTSAYLPNNIYKFLFTLLGFVYVSGLFTPLMDNDAGHHANIALRMYLTGDYVNLVDHAGPYLDKPHLHFWLAAGSFELFGVNSFAYKLPSLLFSIVGVYATYRLGTILQNTQTGKLAALLIASSFAFMLANTDVRMDAILTACIAGAVWQLTAFMQTRKTKWIAGAALFLALGFCTKGHIAVFVPVVAVVFYILYKKEWKLLYNWKWVLLVFLFALFISPVVYCYYLQFNLHPEIEVRGQTNLDGVKFILLNQSIERFGGTMGSDAKNDYLFFVHSFLWAFAPWSILAYLAIGSRIKDFLTRKEEWMTPGVFITLLLIVSFSGFKLPHYLNIVFPTTAVLTAAFLVVKKESKAWQKRFFIIQSGICGLLIMAMVLLHAWAFPLTNPFVIAALVLLLAIVFYFIKSNNYNTWQRAIVVPVTCMALFFFLMNTNFYPQLLSYQGGNMLAKNTRGKVDPANVYFWEEMQSSSYSFYSASIRKQFNDSIFLHQQTVWLLYDRAHSTAIAERGYKIIKQYKATDYEITKLKLKFINPETRESQTTEMRLAQISK